MNVTYRPSPNHNARPAGRGPEIVVMHATAGKSEEGDLGWLCREESQVSYHFLVGRRGEVWQLVQEARRAWHAGKSRWQGRENVNDFSIGVALSHHPDEKVYPEAQLEAAARLVANICIRHGFDGSRIVGHADVSPGRKTDPYPHFPWSRFRKLVIDHMHPPPEPFNVTVPRAA